MAQISLLRKLAEKEGFEPSHRLTQPNPLAGDPLEPLEYFSKHSVYFLFWRDAAKALEAQGFRVEVDYRNEKIGKKIRDAQVEKVPYMVVVGDRDMENGTVSPRHRAAGDLGAMSFEDFEALLKKVVDEKIKDKDL